LVNGGLDSRLRGNDGNNYTSFLRKQESTFLGQTEKGGKRSVHWSVTLLL